ncbi:SRPBCC family protein [Rhodococcoides fascians]|uniref:SRPBCC family protein n=1 Tax=Rhodococcoides fascians TaxID=1828 RepID=UPI00056246F7|nr:MULTISPECIES: SRPBCC family protein [Rhodococcus]OZF04141.1 ATPase [Rhodococcus sp. 15-1189-1-1a]OZF18817.1 ATPase [Rhodococcus sp. 14-2686-1-2]
MTDTSVRRTVTVPVPPETAFALFTDRLGDFKPPEHNLLSVPIAQTVLEQRVGGAIVDRGTDGSECRWARVLVFDRPDLLVFSWDIGPTWEIEDDPARSSEVEVRFVAEGDTSTRIELEHRHLDRHGRGWESVRDGVDDDAGWTLYLSRYADLSAPGGTS